MTNAALAVTHTDEEILDAYTEAVSEKKAAESLGISQWQVRRVVAKAGGTFGRQLAAAKTLDAFLQSLEYVTEHLNHVQPGWEWRAAKELGHLYLDILGERGLKGAHTAVQNIIQLRPDEANRLKETIDSVEGEVIDDSDT